MTAPMSGNPVGKKKKIRGGVMVMLLFYRSTPEMADANPRNERSLLLSSLLFLTLLGFDMSFSLRILSANHPVTMCCTTTLPPHDGALHNGLNGFSFEAFAHRFRRMSRLIKRSSAHAFLPVPGFWPFLVRARPIGAGRAFRRLITVHPPVTSRLGAKGILVTRPVLSPRCCS